MVSKAYIPDRADIVWVDLDPIKGHEERGRRPAIVISPKLYNSRSGLAVICPITSRAKGYPFEVVFKSKKIIGVVLADQVRSVDWQKRNAEFITKADSSIVAEIRERLVLLIS